MSQPTTRTYDVYRLEDSAIMGVSLALREAVSLQNCLGRCAFAIASHGEVPQAVAQEDAAGWELRYQGDTHDFAIYDADSVLQGFAATYYDAEVEAQAMRIARAELAIEELVRQGNEDECPGLDEELAEEDGEHPLTDNAEAHRETMERAA